MSLLAQDLIVFTPETIDVAHEDAILEEVVLDEEIDEEKEAEAVDVEDERRD